MSKVLNVSDFARVEHTSFKQRNMKTTIVIVLLLAFVGGFLLMSNKQIPQNVEAQPTDTVKPISKI